MFMSSVCLCEVALVICRYLMRSFVIAGTNVYANKCVLGARCEVMAAMFGGNFVESRSNMTEV